MNSPPRISVIMPVYNAGRFVGEAIQSVLSQDFSDFELIIFNDASTDNSLDILKSFNDARIRIVENEINLGITKTLNAAIALCRGDFIARMDADDVMHPQRLNRQLEAMELDTGIAVLATRIRFINMDGEYTGEWNTDAENIREGDIRNVMANTNCIAHPTVMMRRDVLSHFGYREKQFGAEDWDLWLRLLNANFRIAKLNDEMLDYRVHTSSITSMRKKEEILEKRLLRIRNNFLLYELTRLKISSFYFLVCFEQLKTILKLIWKNSVIPMARTIKRILTYAPWKLLAQRQKLRAALKAWTGHDLFIFTYVHEGGAEQVHADILRTRHFDQALVIITGFSLNNSFLERFKSHARVIVIPELANHPWTKRSTIKTIAEDLSQRSGVKVFASNNEWFFELIPNLSLNIPLYYLIHAFHFQPNANVLHRGWLRFASRITNYIFISNEAREQFSLFCFHNHQPKSIREKFRFISNAVNSFHEPARHDDLKVLFVGRDSAEKRVNIFLKIAEKTQGIQSGVTFSIVGMSKRPAPPNVIFLGAITNRKQLENVYRDHDLLLVTSNREGFPMVIMEAMAHGLVVGATPVGDIPNRLTKEFAFITSTIEEHVVVDEMTAFILRMKSHPDELRDRKNRSFVIAKDEFGWDKFQDAYRALFDSSNSATTR